MEKIWWLWAMLPALFFSTSVLIDQFLARDHFRESVLAFQATACLINLPLAFGVYLYRPEVLDVSFFMGTTIALTGWIYALGLLPYIKALQQSDASICLPIFQINPFLIAFLGLLFLNETLTPMQWLAGTIIVFGSIAITWDFKVRRFHVTTMLRIFFFALACAVYVVLLRYFAEDIHWLTISFWNMVGWLVLGVVELSFFKKARTVSFAVIHQTKGRVFLWNSGQEVLDNIGIGLMIYVLTFAPHAAGVAFINALQPVYILVFGGLLGLFFPKIYASLSWDRVFALKTMCILLIGLGLYLLTTNA